MSRFMTFPLVAALENILGLGRVCPLNPGTIGGFDISVPTDREPCPRRVFWEYDGDLSHLIGDVTSISERASPDR